MKRFGVAATQGERADVFWGKRLPAYRNLWLLRVVLALRRRLKWGEISGISIVNAKFGFSQEARVDLLCDRAGVFWQRSPPCGRH
jgi:hypothetical protein